MTRLLCRGLRKDKTWRLGLVSIVVVASVVWWQTFSLWAEEPSRQSVAWGIRESFSRQVIPFLNKHCLECHEGVDAEGGVQLVGTGFQPVFHDVGLADEQASSLSFAVLNQVRDQLRDGLMPPEDEPRPAEADLRQVIAIVTEVLGTSPARLPNEGNLIPHELLFGRPTRADSPPPPRVWRLSPQGYSAWLGKVYRGRPDGIVQPFNLVAERGIRDYAALYTVDEPATEVLLRNAQTLVELQTLHEIKDGRVQGNFHDYVREFLPLMEPEKDPTREQLVTAIQSQFQRATGRPATDEETERYLALYEICRQVADRPAAGKTMLQAILLRTEAMFRYEIGQPVPGDGIRSETYAVLTPPELEQAIHATLGTHRPALAEALQAATTKGKEPLRALVKSEVLKLLNDPQQPAPRILEFFHRYFEYPKATEVFKDQPDGFFHEPDIYVSDTDRLVLHIVEQDKDVFRELLTTTKSFVNLRIDHRSVPVQAHVVNLVHSSHRGKVPVESTYGVTNWSKDQPMDLPANERIGVLMQPSWLVAWSTNFDNDPVRRGRWIRERLLGGMVPDLPIGVAAQVPDEPQHTFRQRLGVTRESRCWKCHRNMDDLGLPFEQFDHFGRYRTTEAVHDLEATSKNVDSKGQPRGVVFAEATLDTSGHVSHSGDASLDGPVRDPREMIRRIADSDRARQVFVWHVFRYFMGRNESLDDARTLQEADRDYVESGGSFKTLVASLLASDAFLNRSWSTKSVNSPEER